MTAEPMTESRPSPRVPRWLVRTIWFLHRRAYALTGGRFGLRPPAERQWGMLRLESIGRKSGRTRQAILGYILDGQNVVVPAMNGWADAEPAWWLNLQANPAATIELPGGDRRRVLARAADPEQRSRLWRELVELGSSAYTDANAATRSRETAIVILEPEGCPG